MEINYFTIIATIINIVLLAAIIVVILKGIQGFKKFINRNKEIDKKLDIILNRLENNEDK